MSKKSNALEDAFSDFLKKSLKDEEKNEKKAVVSAFKKALDSTTPERPGDPRDFKEVKPKKDKDEWW